MPMREPESCIIVDEGDHQLKRKLKTLKQALLSRKINAEEHDKHIITLKRNM